jgi:hypothetical protein
VRTGLLTIHSIENYGSVLQAYATQRVLDEVVEASDIIDYRYPTELHRSTISTRRRVQSSVLARGNAFLKDLLPGRQYTQYVDRYQEAKRDWFRLSSRYETRQELSRADHYDAYVVGSDQVWHPRTVGPDPSFFLDFAPSTKLRIAYASSFGSLSIPANLHEYYRTGLRSLDAISVREESGVRLVRGLTGREPDLVLDPTLMLGAEQWQAEAVAPPSVGRPYILCYGSNPGSDYMERLALEIQRFTGWSVIRLNGKFHNAFNRKIRYVLNAGPREWLGYMANASLVLGQSFHATAFALNFERPFISLLRGDSDHDARQVEFLDSVGLGDSVVTEGQPLPNPRGLALEANYDRAHAILGERRERSVGFLRKVLA